jgi:hypothetical protein
VIIAFEGTLPLIGPLLDTQKVIHNQRRITLCHVAPEGHDTDMVVMMLLDGGADVNAKGIASLYQATYSSYETAVRMLLDEGLGFF